MIKLKRTLRLLLVGLSCALAFGTLLCGFAVADRNIRTTTFPENEPIAEIRLNLNEMRCDVSLLGTDYRLGLGWANKLSGLAQSFSCFAPPGLRLGAKLAAIGARELEYGVNAAS